MLITQEKCLESMAVKSSWYVYMVRCKDDSLYTGISTDVSRRVEEHNSDLKGAKYTKARQPVTLVYKKRCKDRSGASKAEAALKHLSRTEKLKLLN